MTLLEEILEASGADMVAGAKPGEINICCPFCADGDSGHHLGVNVEKGVGYCFRCHWKMRGFYETAKALAEVYGVRLSGLRTKVRKATRIAQAEAAAEETDDAAESALPAEYESLLGRVDMVGKLAKRYLRGRGVTLHQIVKHRVGFAACGTFSWRVLFPVLNDAGTVCGCVGRALTEGQKPRYLNTPDMRYVWGAQQDGAVAVLSEGIMDALHVERVLLRRGPWISLARLGSELSGAQMKQLKKYERVILFPDSDRPGMEAVAVDAERCMAAGIAVRVCVPERLDGSDPGSMTDDMVMDVIADARPWNSTTAYRLRAAMTRYGEL